MSEEVLIDQVIEEPVEEIVENPVEEINEPEPEPEKVPKGVQKRIDEITREKYEERRERQRAQERADRLEAELAAIRSGAQQQQRQLPNGAPDPDQYPAGRYDPDYLEALTDFKVQARFEAQREQATLQQRKAAIQEAEAKARQQYPDYDHASEEFLTHPLARVPAFTQLVMDTDNPTEIAYYFGKNPVELDKISEMTPSQAARYIGRIEASLAEKTSDAVVKKASSAPKPISALSGAKNTSVITDLSQAKTMAEYNALREKQLAAKK